MTRVPYPDPAGLPTAASAAIASMRRPLNLVRMISHAPTLVSPMVDLGTALLFRLALPLRYRELLILLVAARTRCDYELRQHLPIAREAGVTEPEITAVLGGSPWPAEFGAVEGVLLQAADELLTTATWKQQTLDAVLGCFTAREAVEICHLVGHYRTLAGLLNAFDVDVDPQGEHFVGSRTDTA